MIKLDQFVTPTKTGMSTFKTQKKKGQKQIWSSM